MHCENKKAVYNYELVATPEIPQRQFVCVNGFDFLSLATATTSVYLNYLL